MRVKLEELVEEVSERTTINNQFPVLTSSRSGIYLQEDYFKKQVASKDNTGYKVIRKGEFTYRAMSDTGEFYPNKLECTDIGIVSPAYPVFKIKDNRVLPDYLKYYFKSRSFQKSIIAFVQGSTRASMKFGKMKSILIDLPDKNKQKQILNTIEILEDIINKYKLEINRLDKLIKARFVEMFGDPVVNPKAWDTESLVRNATLLNGRAYSQEELLDSGKYPVLRVGNFFSNRGWYYSDLELSDDKYCDTGDLLYAWSASFGPKIWDGGKVIYHYHIWKILVGEKYNKIFLCKLLEYVTLSLMDNTHGIGMMHLTKSGMEKTNFIVPPMQLQNEFEHFVARVDKSKFAVQKSLEKTQQLFDSLMQEYFG